MLWFSVRKGPPGELLHPEIQRFTRFPVTDVTKVTQRVCPTATHELGLVLHHQPDTAGGVQGKFSTRQNIPAVSRAGNSKKPAKSPPPLTSPGREDTGDKVLCLSDGLIPAHRGNFISKIDKSDKERANQALQLGVY